MTTPDRSTFNHGATIVTTEPTIDAERFVTAVRVVLANAEENAPGDTGEKIADSLCILASMLRDHGERQMADAFNAHNAHQAAEVLAMAQMLKLAAS